MSRSMALNAASGFTGMLKDGHKSFEGVFGAVLKNIEAGKAIAQMVQTSMGPNGMNKLIVNHLEKIFVTSDCGTILGELEVQHPAAKILVLAAQMQESEYGDNTNFVVSFAGELLVQAEELIREGLHTSEIISGYQRAYEKTLEILPQLVVHNLENPRDVQEISECIRAVLSTKQVGYEDMLSKLVSEACLTTVAPTVTRPRLNMDSVRIAKLRGGSVNQSSLLNGMVLLRDSEGIVKRAENAKVAVFGVGFEASSTEAKSTVLLKSAEELLNYNKSEEKKMEEIVAGIAATGVKVVVCNGSISEMALHFLDRYGIMVIKVSSKFDTRRLCLALGATAVVRLGPPTPEEMGFCSLVEVREIASRKILVFSQELKEDTAISTILLRAATENVLNDLERSIDDGVHAVKALWEDSRLLPGAGAVELEVSHRLKVFAESEPLGLDHYGVRKFAQALEVVPRTLVENAGQDATSKMQLLQASHRPSVESSSSSSSSSSCNMGWDLENNQVMDAHSHKVWDLYGVKLNALRLAVDAALTVLKIDQIVMSKPAGGPKPKNATDNDF